MIVPPFRYGLVETDVFRCAQPTLKNYRFISRLKPRTVVAIAPEAPVADEVMFCQQQGAQLLPIRAELYREEAVTITFQQVAQVLSVLVDPDRLPALVHCPDGRVLTGVVLWCLRKLQCWDKTAAVAEYMRYCSGVPPTREVEKFADGFGDEVTIPARIPRWLWGGDRTHRHPGIRLRHEPPLEPSEADSTPSEMMRRGSPQNNTGGLSLQDQFSHNIEDMSDMMDEEGPNLSRAVQALSLEGLNMSESHHQFIG